MTPSDERPGHIALEIDLALRQPSRVPQHAIDVADRGQRADCPFGQCFVASEPGLLERLIAEGMLAFFTSAEKG